MNKWPDDVVNRFKCWWDNRETRCGETHVNCRDCPFHVPGYSMQDAVKDAIGWFYRLEAAQPKWISVEEPPKHTCDYLVYVWVAYPDGIAHMQMRTGIYNIVRKEWTIPHDQSEVVGEPKCWMPLPEPPKEDV